jgi:ABC-type hemin transport system substrate-binding protein
MERLARPALKVTPAQLALRVFKVSPELLVRPGQLVPKVIKALPEQLALKATRV